MGEERGGGRTQGPGRKRRSEGTRRHHSVPGVGTLWGRRPGGSAAADDGCYTLYGSAAAASPSCPGRAPGAGPARAGTLGPRDPGLNLHSPNFPALWPQVSSLTFMPQSPHLKWG